MRDRNKIAILAVTTVFVFVAVSALFLALDAENEPDRDIFFAAMFAASIPAVALVIRAARFLYNLALGQPKNNAIITAGLVLIIGTAAIYFAA